MDSYRSNRFNSLHQPFIHCKRGNGAGNISAVADEVDVRLVYRHLAEIVDDVVIGIL